MRRLWMVVCLAMAGFVGGPATARAADHHTHHHRTGRRHHHRHRQSLQLPEHARKAGYDEAAPTVASRQYFGMDGSTSSLQRRMPPTTLVARKPAAISCRAASALRFPERQ